MRRRSFYATLRVVAMFAVPALIVSAQSGQQSDKPFYRTKPPATAKPDTEKPDTAKTDTAKTKPPSSISQKIEKEGISLNFSFQSAGREGIVEGTDAVVSFQLTDARTGQPLTGIRPLGWINSRSSERVPTDGECKDTIRSFLGGLLSVRPDIDLNGYQMLTLNHDKTISVINPQVSFSITKLEGLITLPGSGADWALSNDKESLYVTIPDKSAVVVINTIKRKIVGAVSTGEKTKPMRTALQPGGRYVWVGLDDSPSVAVIETAANKLAATIEVGAGLHNIAFTSDGRFAYVTNSASDTVSAIDTKTLSKVAEIKVAKTPVPVAYSSASNFIYVAAINGAEITVIDPARQQVVATIPARRGIVALRFEPAGRYGFAVNQIESEVSVIDSSTSKIIGSVAVAKGPDQVVFTRGYAYVRATESEKFSLIGLSDIKNGKFQPVNIQAGQLPASEASGEIGVASMIAPTPEGNSVMIANTPDSTVYYYVEGMMAPMGSFSNYKRRPHALMLIDRSLTETLPGVYSTPIKLRKPGRFNVAVLTDQPRLTHCFQLDVAQSPNSKRQTGAAIAVEPLFKGKQLKLGKPATLTFKITDPVTNEPVKGLKDVQVLIVEPPGVWQTRLWAKEAGEGLYEVTQDFPESGLYRVMLQVESRGVMFNHLPFVSVPVNKE
jgi:YVTN family beta-propeller protein